MKQTTIPVKEDLKWRLNQLKYAWGYKTLDSVIRHLIDVKTPKIIPAKSHQNSSTPSFFCPSGSKEGAVHNHRAVPEVKEKGTRCRNSSDEKEKN